MNHIKNIFIRSAAYEDGVVINGRTVKYKNQDAPKNVVEFDSLRVSFTSFEDSDLERLDSAFIDVPFQKTQQRCDTDILILARGSRVKLQII